MIRKLVTVKIVKENIIYIIIKIVRVISTSMYRYYSNKLYVILNIGNNLNRKNIINVLKRRIRISSIHGCTTDGLHTTTFTHHYIMQ